MILKVNNVVMAAYPTKFQVTPLDIDDADSSVRSASGYLTRDRVATKRQIEMEFGLLKWADMSSVLQSMADVFFDFYYPDPMSGVYETRTVYVGNRPSGVAVSKDGDIRWSGLKITLTEQ